MKMKEQLEESSKQWLLIFLILVCRLCNWRLQESEEATREGFRVSRKFFLDYSGLLFCPFLIFSVLIIHLFDKRTIRQLFLGKIRKYEYMTT